MFIAIIFVCLTSGECSFVHSSVIESERMCMSILQQQADIVRDNKDKIAIAQGQCIKLVKGKSEV